MTAKKKIKPYYDYEALTKLDEAYQSLDFEKNELLLNFTQFPFSSDTAREFAHHGFLRRVGILNKCIHNIFSITPADQVARISSEQANDVSINLQAFVVNIFGCLDNIAWVWVHHKQIKIDKKQVGLKPKHTALRKTLSPTFRQTLESFNPWFEYIENYRDALAHRIPLYVPSFSLNPEDAELYKELEAQKWSALKAGQVAKSDAINEQQDKLGRFYPWMHHSFSEEGKAMAYHAQIMADWKTIIHLGEHFMIELKSE